MRVDPDTDEPQGLPAPKAVNAMALAKAMEIYAADPAPMNNIDELCENWQPLAETIAATKPTPKSDDQMEQDTPAEMALNTTPHKRQRLDDQQDDGESQGTPCPKPRNAMSTNFTFTSESMKFAGERAEHLPWGKPISTPPLYERNGPPPLPET